MEDHFLTAAARAKFPPEADAVVLPARVAAISGFLANPEYGGNAGKAGWRAIGSDDRFGWAEPFW